MNVELSSLSLLSPYEVCRVSRDQQVMPRM
jgi:hypothetical protein